MHCYKQERKFLPANLYARKMEGSVAGRREGIYFKERLNV